MRRPKLLSGTRVVAVEQAVAAPLCTRHLRDFGADVVKVERVDGGDFARRYDGVVHGESAHFVWLNRGKRSVAIDLKTVEGCAVLDRLLARADVFVSNLASASLDRLLPDPELAHDHPELIRCYITGFGSAGPLSGRKVYDALAQGEAGVTASTGTPDHPAKSGISVADVGAGAYAFGAVSAAIAARLETGVGCRIEVSLFDVLTEWMSPLLLAYEHGGTVPVPSGTHHASIVPYGTYRTNDGDLVNLAVQNEGQWQRLCRDLLGDERIARRPRFRTNSLRVEHRDEVDDLVAEALGQLPWVDACRLLDQADVPWGRVNQVPDVCAHEEVVARGRWEAVVLPEGGRARALRDPIVIDGRQSVGGSLPALGGHTREVLTELGYRSGEVERMAAAGTILLGDRSGA